MSYPKVCKDLRKKLIRFSRVLYGHDLEADLNSRSHELWLIGIDSKSRTFIDICGTISAADLQAINDRGFFDTDAGYKVSAQSDVPISKKADIFLLNKDYFALDEKRTTPLIVHELAHLLEQLNMQPNAIHNDDANAEAILTSLHPDVLKRHTKEWALHLAVGARLMFVKNLTKCKTIGDFLEAAVPSYDRVNPVRASKGW